MKKPIAEYTNEQNEQFVVAFNILRELYIVDWYNKGEAGQTQIRGEKQALEFFHKKLKEIKEQ